MPEGGSVTGVTEAQAAARAFAIRELGWTPGWLVEDLNRLVEIALSAARSVDPLQERVRELEEALNEIDKQFGYCLPARYTRMIRAALSPGSLQGEKDG